MHVRRNYPATPAYVKCAQRHLSRTLHLLGFYGGKGGNLVRQNNYPLQERLSDRQSTRAARSLLHRPNAHSPAPLARPPTRVPADALANLLAIVHSQTARNVLRFCNDSPTGARSRRHPRRSLARHPPARTPRPLAHTRARRRTRLSPRHRVTPKLRATCFGSVTTPQQVHVNTPEASQGVDRHA